MIFGFTPEPWLRQFIADARAEVRGAKCEKARALHQDRLECLLWQAQLKVVDGVAYLEGEVVAPALFERYGLHPPDHQQEAHEQKRGD